MFLTKNVSFYQTIILYFVLSTTLTKSINLNLDANLDFGKWKFNYDLRSDNSKTPPNVLKQSNEDTSETQNDTSSVDQEIQDNPYQNTNNNNKLVLKINTDDFDYKAKENDPSDHENIGHNRDNLKPQNDDTYTFHDEVVHNIWDKLSDIFQNIYRKSGQNIKHKKNKIITTTTPPTTKREKMRLFAKTPLRISEEKAIMTFLRTEYKKSLEFLKGLKNGIDDDRIEKELKLLTRSYGDKYEDFLEKNSKIEIKSRLGKRKVLINGVETSNRLLTRILDHLKIKTGELRSKTKKIHKYEKVLREKYEEAFDVLCTNFGICNNSNSFSHFLIRVFDVIQTAPDNKALMFLNGITEEAKSTKFNTLLDRESIQNVMKSLEMTEKIPEARVKPFIGIITNTLLHINTPIQVVGVSDARVNKTIAFGELINLYNTKLVENDENKKEWDALVEGYKQWIALRTDTIQMLSKKFLEQFLKIDPLLSADEKMDFNRMIHVLFAAPK